MDDLYFQYWPALLYVFYFNDTLKNSLSLGGAFGLATINMNLLPWTPESKTTPKAPFPPSFKAVTSSTGLLPGELNNYTYSTPHQVLAGTLSKYLLPSLTR